MRSTDFLNTTIWGHIFGLLELGRGNGDSDEITNDSIHLLPRNDPAITAYSEATSTPVVYSD